MIYEFISSRQDPSDSSLVITFNRQFHPNWLQRLLGYKPRCRYVQYIGFDQHWWDLTDGQKVPRPVWEQCNLIYRRFQDEQARQVTG